VIPRLERNSRTWNYKCWISLCPVGLKTVEGWGSDPVSALCTVNIGQSVVSVFAPYNWFIWRETSASNKCLCVPVQNGAPAAKWRHWLKHPDVGLFLLPSSRNWRLYINHIQDYCSSWTMHTDWQHRPHCATGHCFAWNETQTVPLVDESIKLYTLNTPYTSEGAYCRKLQEEYCKWGLTMNITKTKYMSLGKGKKQSRYRPGVAQGVLGS
jgi:hypothetical protein